MEPDTTDTSSAKEWPGLDAVRSAVAAWRRYDQATTATTQADRLITLSNAMDQLATWIPT